MKRIITFIAALLLAACAGMNTKSLTSPDGQLTTGYNTVNAYVQWGKESLARGAISTTQAQAASERARKATATLDTARTALEGCNAAPATPTTALPCSNYLTLMQGLQPALWELERELRAAQGAKK